MNLCHHKTTLRRGKRQKYNKEKEKNKYNFESHEDEHRKVIKCVRENKKIFVYKKRLLKKKQGKVL